MVKKREAIARDRAVIPGWQDLTERAS